MKIAIGCDHAGVELKEVLIQLITELKHDALDKGPFSSDSVDYPDYGHAVALAVDEGDADLGVVICGSGNGINMTVNKHQGIRGALCWTPEIAGACSSTQRRKYCSNTCTVYFNRRGKTDCFRVFNSGI